MIMHRLKWFMIICINQLKSDYDRMSILLNLVYALKIIRRYKYFKKRNCFNLFQNCTIFLKKI